MLLPIFPEAHVTAAVRPFVDAVTVLLVIVILPFVLLLVRPDILPKTVHVPAVPLADVVPAIFPLDHAKAVDFILVPLAIEARAICPQVRAQAVLLAFCVIAQVVRAIWPGLFPLTMHLALEPLASVDVPVRVSVDTIPAHQVTGPAALVNVAIRVDELPIPAGLVTAPGSAIRSSIRPLHFALTVAHASQPLSHILGASCQVLIIDPLLAVDEVAHLQVLRVCPVLLILSPLGVNVMPAPYCLPILVVLKVLERKLCIMLSLHAQVLLEPPVRQEASYTCLHHCYLVPVLPVKLSVVDVAVVLGEEGFASQRRVESVLSYLKLSTGESFTLELLCSDEVSISVKVTLRTTAGLIGAIAHIDFIFAGTVNYN